MAQRVSALLARSKLVAARLFEGRMLVITSQDSMLHRLNEVGTFIWEYLEKPQTLESIIAAVDHHFKDFDQSEAGPQIKDFVNDLIEKKLIEESPALPRKTKAL